MQGTSSHPSRRPRRRLAVAALIGGLLTAAAPAAAAPTWLAPSNLSEPGGANLPQVAVNASGTAAAIWRRFDGTNLRIQASTRLVGGTWESPLYLSDAAQDAGDAQVAIDAFGNLTAIWRAPESGASRVQVSTRPAGGSWQAPFNLSDAGTGGFGGRVAVDGAGTATATWLQSDGTKYRTWAATRAVGGTWQVASPLSDPGQNAAAAHVAVSAAGDATAIWTRSDGTNTRLQTATRPAGGTWQPPTYLSDPGKDARDPQLAVNAAGTAVAVWQRSDGSNFRVEVATRPAGGAWQPAVPISDPDQPARSPQVALNTNGDATAIWYRYDGSKYRAQAATRPAGGAWQSPANLSDAGQNAGAPQIAVDAAGNSTAVWSRSDGAKDRIQSSTRAVGGTWQAPVNLSDSGQDASDPQVAVDLAGNATAVWKRFDGTTDRVQTASLDAAGPTIGAVSVPASAIAGTPIAVSAAATDVWSAIAGTSWSFGDGGSATTAAAAHTFTKPGSYTVTVTSTDAVGNASSATRQIAVAVAPLTVSGKTATFNATLALKKSAKSCPKAKALTITLRGKKALLVTKRKLNTVTKTASGCLLTGNLTLKKPVKAGTKVTAKIAAKGLKTTTLSAVAG